MPLWALLFSFFADEGSTIVKLHLLQNIFYWKSPLSMSGSDTKVGKMVLYWEGRQLDAADWLGRSAQGMLAPAAVPLTLWWLSSSCWTMCHMWLSECVCHLRKNNHVWLNKTFKIFEFRIWGNEKKRKIDWKESILVCMDDCPSSGTLWRLLSEQGWGNSEC